MKSLQSIFRLYGRVRLARFAREIYAYGASRLSNREEKKIVLQSTKIWQISTPESALNLPSDGWNHFGVWKNEKEVI